MKKSELTVTMRMTDFEELLAYKDMYSKLKDELGHTLIRRDTSTWDFNVNQALNIIKKLYHISNDANITTLI